MHRRPARTDTVLTEPAPAAPAEVNGVTAAADPPTSLPGYSIAGAHEVATERVLEARVDIARARENGDVWGVVEGEARERLCHAVVVSIEREQNTVRDWAANPERLAAVEELAWLVDEGGAKLRAELDTAIDGVHGMRAAVDEYNGALRRLNARVRAGEPGSYPGYMVPHPGEVNLAAYVVAKLREATR